MKNVKSKPSVFQVSDVVLTSKQILTFEKGYGTNWKIQLFVMTECVSRDTTMYLIKGLLHETIQGKIFPKILKTGN